MLRLVLDVGTYPDIDIVDCGEEGEEELTGVVEISVTESSEEREH